LTDINGKLTVIINLGLIITGDQTFTFISQVRNGTVIKPAGQSSAYASIYIIFV